MGEDMAGGGEGRGYSAAGLIYREGYGRSWAAPEDGPSTQGPPRPPGWRRTQRNRRRHKRRFKSPSPPTAIASSRLPPPAPPVPRLAPRSARSLCHGSYRRSSTASSHNEPRHHNLDFVHMPQLLFTASMGHLSHSAAHSPRSSVPSSVRLPSPKHLRVSRSRDLSTDQVQRPSVRQCPPSGHILCAQRASS